MIPSRPEVVGFDDYGFAIFAEGSLHASNDHRCHDYRFVCYSNFTCMILESFFDLSTLGATQSCQVQMIKNLEVVGAFSS